jgi:hypothetical protein
MSEPSTSEPPAGDPQPRWDSYVAFCDGDSLVVDIDLATRETRVRGARPALLRIELEIIAPDEHGQPSEMEGRQLDFEQDQLDGLLERHGADGRLIARTTCRGTRELVLALPELGRADYALRKWTRKLERECEVQPLDGGWDFVDQHLLPGQAERDWMEARDAVLQALERGATPGAPSRLLIQGRPALEVALDPFAIVAELTRARSEGAPVGTWTLG